MNVNFFVNYSRISPGFCFNGTFFHCFLPTRSAAPAAPLRRCRSSRRPRLRSPRTSPPSGPWCSGWNPKSSGCGPGGISPGPGPEGPSSARILRPLPDAVLQSPHIPGAFIAPLHGLDLLQKCLIICHSLIQIHWIASFSIWYHIFQPTARKSTCKCRCFFCIISHRSPRWR